jgi:hypothetical protein
MTKMPNPEHECYACQKRVRIAPDNKDSNMRLVWGCECVRYRIRAGDTANALKEADPDTRALVSAAAQRITKSRLPPPERLLGYAKQIADGKWWLNIGSKQSIVEIAKIESQLQQQEKDAPEPAKRLPFSPQKKRS